MGIFKIYLISIFSIFCRLIKYTPLLLPLLAISLSI